MVQTTNISIDDLRIRFCRRSTQLSDATLLYHKQTMSNHVKYVAYDKYVYDGHSWSLTEVLKISDIRITKDHHIVDTNTNQVLKNFDVANRIELLLWN